MAKAHHVNPCGGAADSPCCSPTVQTGRYIHPDFGEEAGVYAACGTVAVETPHLCLRIFDVEVIVLSLAKILDCLGDQTEARFALPQCGGFAGVDWTVAAGLRRTPGLGKAYGSRKAPDFLCQVCLY